MASTPRLAPATSVGAGLLARLDALAEIEASEDRSLEQEGGASHTRCGRRPRIASDGASPDAILHIIFDMDDLVLGIFSTLLPSPVSCSPEWSSMVFFS
jgi:hypothetical protein